MKLKMRAPLAGPDRDPAFAGDFLEVSDEEAKDLIDRGFAEEARGEEAAVAEPAAAAAADPALQPDPPADPAKDPAKAEEGDKKE